MRAIQWALVGEASIAFETVGKGPDVVEVQAGAALAWSEHPLTRSWPEQVQEFARFTCYDAQGTGRSDPLAPDRTPTLEDKVSEAIAVMDAAGITQAVLVGFFAGAPAALAIAALHPERVKAVVAVNGYARLTATGEFPVGLPASVRGDLENSLRDRFGTGWMVRRWLPTLAGVPEVEAYMEQYEQTLSSRGQVVLGAKLVSSLDVRDLLDRVTVPVTIVHAIDNQVVPIALGRDLHARLSGSQLVEVPTSHHMFTFPPVLDETVAAVQRATASSAVLRATSHLAAVLFTDIVSSTTRLARLNDRNWKPLLAEYHRLADETAKRFRGRVVKTTGDGVLAVFDSAASATRCAGSLARVANQLGLVTRGAVHVGDIESVLDDITGLTVHVAARLLDLAGDGEVIITGTAAEAAIGAGLDVLPGGEVTLRDVPGTWRIFVLNGA